VKGLRFYGKNRKTNIVGQGFEADPLAGLANLLDLCLVFIVGLILTIFNLYNMQELFDPKADHHHEEKQGRHLGDYYKKGE